MTPDQSFDVLIGGGGMVGATLALALARNPSLRIGLAETHNIGDTTQAAHYDDRTVALAHGTRLILEQLDVWQSLQAHCEPIVDIHISERGRFGATRLNAREEGVPALGYVIENRLLGNAVIERLQGCKNVVLLGGYKLGSLQQCNDHVVVNAKAGDNAVSLKARLLVAADGAQSSLREMAGIKAQQRDYHQHAIIANVSAEQGHNNIAYERFTDTGPLALLPMPNNRCSMVMTVNSTQLDGLMQCDEQAFLAVLQERFGQRMGRFTRVGKRSHFPLKLITAEKHSAGRVLLIGNARHNLHPVSGQGFNLAMRDVGVVTELINTDGCDPGAPELLAVFGRRRRGDHQTIEKMTDTLARLFLPRFLPLSHARAAGLIVTDLLPPVRHLLARQSMGLRERLPRLFSAAP